MSLYAIGAPGHPVRQFVRVSNPDDAQLNRQDGEVAIVVDSDERGTICDKGVSVIPMGIDMIDELLRIRHIRTAKLAACDWTQTLDVQLSDEKRAEWAAYRQQLRDITETQPDVACDDIVWPDEPTP